MEESESEADVFFSPGKEKERGTLALWVFFQWNISLLMSAQGWCRRKGDIDVD